jgi:predicted transcriptional regulator
MTKARTMSRGDLGSFKKSPGELERRAKKAPRAHRTLRIGIASVSEMRARSLAIARGELKPKPTDPKVWFPSAEALGKVLSGKNKDLLDRIRREHPASLQDLSEITGRKVPSLSRTLRTMEKYGLVSLERGPRGSIRPSVPYDEVDVRISLKSLESA